MVTEESVGPRARARARMRVYARACLRTDLRFYPSPSVTVTGIINGGAAISALSRKH